LDSGCLVTYLCIVDEGITPHSSLTDQASDPRVKLEFRVLTKKHTHMKRITNLTELEKQVLQSIADKMYAEEGFSDVGATDIARATKIEMKALRGVLSSLVKKSLLYIEDRSDNIGYRANDPSWEPIIYLSGDAFGLVEHWVKESGGELEPAIIG
jgi:hypothetical protein